MPAGDDCDGACLPAEPSHRGRTNERSRHQYTFIAFGFAFVIVDLRGRGGSEGEFDPYRQEATDAHDAIKWLGRQPWCNGKIGMYGGSYSGSAQWQAARAAPAALATTVPTAAPCTTVDVPGLNGIFYFPVIQLLTVLSGHAMQMNLFTDGAFWTRRALRYYTEHAAFRSLDQIVGNVRTVFAKWMNHPVTDSYWEPLAIKPEQYKRIRFPILSITGQFDEDQPGALEYYRLHSEHGDPEVVANHYLVIGPWDHSGTQSPRKSVGGITFGDAGAINILELHRGWYDWTLRGAPQRPVFLQKRVAYYVTGSETWKYADSLQGIPTAVQNWYLDSTDGAPNDVAHAGTLQRSTHQEGVGSDTYVYDPLDTRYGEQFEKTPNPNFLTDQRSFMNLFGNGLVYDSAPLGEGIEITGFVRLTAFISMDVADTDFQAYLYEVHPDGSTMLLTLALLRARYRESTKSPILVPKGEIVRYEFHHFRFFSRFVTAGNKLRLVISSPNTINLQKNYNSGGVVEDETGAQAQTAHISLHHTLDHANVLTLPVVV